MNKKISYSGLKNVLSPKQMKNVLGGSALSCPETCNRVDSCLTDIGIWGHCKSLVWACACVED